jgi:hypothetical protein
MEEMRTPEQLVLDAEIELEMIPIRRANDVAINQAYFFGVFLVGLLVVVKYILPLLLI